MNYFILFHTLLSLVALASGFVVMGGLLANRGLNAATATKPPA